MGVLASNSLTRRILKLFRLRRKSKFMPAAESKQWQEDLRSFYKAEYGLEFHPLQCNEMVIPPPSVVAKVQGRNKSDPNTFFGTGCRDTLRYLTALHDHGYNIQSMDKMLDLGFGLGRILYNFLPFSIERYGCDVNPLAHEWAIKNLGEHTHLSVSQLEPPSAYEDNSFDLIISTSVFTHTPYELQPRWIEEFKRILKPGGVALVTVHDPNKLPAQWRQRGWYEVGMDRGIHMNIFFTEDKVRELWNESLNFLELRQYPSNQALLIAGKPR